MVGFLNRQTNAGWCFAEHSRCINYFPEKQNWNHLKQKEGAEGLVLAPLQLLFAFMRRGLCLLCFPVPPITASKHKLARLPPNHPRNHSADEP